MTHSVPDNSYTNPWKISTNSPVPIDQIDPDSSKSLLAQGRRMDQRAREKKSPSER
jgi:hypothetical protein